MITQAQLNQIKRHLCERMLREMPDEALGELLADMREMMDFYKHDSLLSDTQPAKPAPEVARAG